MCDFGITAGVISAVGAVASAAVTGVGASRAGKYAAKTADYEAKDARMRGAIEARNHRQRIEQMLGRQRAQAAGSGFVTDAGSNLDIFTDTELYGDYDSMTIRANAARDAAAARSAGNLARYEGSMGAAAAGISGASSLLSTASKYGSQYAQYRRMDDDVGKLIKKNPGGIF